jgi:5'(3')-deoxyribonucleotidase
MSKPRLLLDVDGVLADFLTPSLEVLRTLTGKSFRTEDFPYWDLFRVVDPKWEAPFFRALGQPGVARSLEVYPGAQQGVARLHEMVDVYIVTTQLRGSPTWTHDREVWLQTHFSIPSHRVVHTSAKHLCTGEVFVDDRPENVLRWSKAHPKGIGLLWDAPWNRLDVVPERVFGWDSLLETLAVRYQGK